MSVSFSWKPPAGLSKAAALELLKLSGSLQIHIVQKIFVAALIAQNQRSAAKAIENAKFSLVGTTIKVQTSLSKTMLPSVLSKKAQDILLEILGEWGANEYLIQFLSANFAGSAAEQNQIILDNKTDPTEEHVVHSAPFKRLVRAAAQLNTVSDQLSIQIEAIETALKKLNLGVSAWVTIEQSEDEDGNWLHEELGYTRIGSRWGVALRTRSGMNGDPGDPDESFSSFSDSPRQLRIRAVPHIPKLIERLSVEAETMIAALSPKVDEVTELTLALQSVGGGDR